MARDKKYKDPSIPWTGEEDATAASCLETCPTVHIALEEVSRRTGRSANKCRMRLIELGLLAPAPEARVSRKKISPEKLAMLVRQDVFSSGDVAKLTNVAPRTAQKWIDNGDLKGFRLPRASKSGMASDRRTTRAFLIEFITKTGLPNPFKGEEAGKIVLTVGVRGPWAGAVEEELPVGWKAVKKGTLLGAAVVLSQMPEVVIVDQALGTPECLEFLGLIKKASVVTVALLTEDQSPQHASGYTYYLTYPHDHKEVAKTFIPTAEGKL